MKNRTFETLIGAIVLLIAVGFVYFAYTGAELKTDGNAYKIYAKFESVDGLSVGSDVKVGGIKVGVVSAQRLDQESYKASIELSVQENIKLPKDSLVSIVGDGLLGGKFVSIVPGSDDQMIPQGGELKYTQSAVNFETLLGKFIFGGVDKKNASSETNNQPTSKETK